MQEESGRGEEGMGKGKGNRDYIGCITEKCCQNFAVSFCLHTEKGPEVGGAREEREGSEKRGGGTCRQSSN